MKIVYLDIDKVLNSCSSIEAFGTEEEFDPVACCLLRKLVKAHNAHIVIVSSRRVGKSVAELRGMFTKLAGKKLGRRVVDKVADVDLPKGELIRGWEEANDFHGPHVIIDDKTDGYTAQQMNCHVQPDPDHGFHIREYNDACKLLSAEVRA